jgi:hypothetical protein
MPIEQLAQLLLQCARADAALPRRTPANDDALHARYVDDMFHRIEPLPELRREAQALPLDPLGSAPIVPTTAGVSNQDLEKLVAIAIESAQDAEDISREAREASRKARRGMFVAIALAAVGIAVAGAATIGDRLYGGEKQQMADIARQVQALGDLQRHINDRLADLHAAAPVQEAYAAPVQQASAVPVQQASAPMQEVNAAPVQQASTPMQRTSAAPAQQASAAPVPLALAPLTAVPVRVLPAAPAMPQATPPATYSSHSAAAAPLPRTEAPAASFAAAASYTAYPPPPADYAPRAASNGTVAPYHPRPRRYSTVVLPRPVAFLIGAVRRDVRTLLR